MMSHRFLDSIKNKTILVVGDVMIDRYISGRVTKISPEAPVPILNIETQESRLGGAGNVAQNIKSLGALPVLCTVVGNDEQADCLYELLESKKLDKQGVIRDSDRKTTVKCRMISKGAQLLRIDDEDPTPMAEALTQKLINKISQIIENQPIDAIIFVDYDKGVISQQLIETLTQLAAEKSIVTAVDPKIRHFECYNRVTLFKPNLKEFSEGTALSSTASLDELKVAMRQFAIQHNIENLMVTLSEEGVVLYDSKTNIFSSQPAFLRNICDVSGAGDTVIAVATLSIAAGYTPEKSMIFANLAGGIVCEYRGVVSITAEMLAAEIQQNGIS